MSREDVIRHIVKREQAGLDLREEAMLGEALELHQAACEQFGTWGTALQYAGVNPRRLSAKQAYTSEYVLRRIQCLCRDGYSIRANDSMRRDRRLYDTARRYYGTWQNALQAAGVNLEFAGLRSGKPRRHKREKILNELRQWLAAGHSRKWLDISLKNHALASAVKQVFGSWYRAMLAVNAAPEPKPPTMKEKWSPERIIECIRARHQEGKPVNYNAVHVDARPLLSSARHYFGNWRNALAAAGMEAEQRSPGRPAKKD